MCSSPPLGAPKSQLVVEQPLIRCWNIPKKDTPSPKTKNKLQQDGRRGTITIKSNPIPTGWVTHKMETNYTKEVLPLLWRFRTPFRFTSLGTWESSENLTLKVSGIWLQDFHRTGENRDFSLGGRQQNLACTKTQRKSSNVKETEPKLPASVGRSPVEARVGKGSAQGWGTNSSCLEKSPLASWRSLLTWP